MTQMSDFKEGKTYWCTYFYRS